MHLFEKQCQVQQELKISEEYLNEGCLWNQLGEFKKKNKRKHKKSVSTYDQQKK